MLLCEQELTVSRNKPHGKNSAEKLHSLQSNRSNFAKVAGTFTNDKTRKWAMARNIGRLL
jgi:hypothetical protein